MPEKKTHKGTKTLAASSTRSVRKDLRRNGTIFLHELAGASESRDGNKWWYRGSMWGNKRKTWNTNRERREMRSTAEGDTKLTGSRSFIDATNNKHNLKKYDKS